MAEPLNLAEVRATWLVQCGPCDYGLVEYGCNCPPGDYRPVLLRAVDELEQARAERDRYRAAINAARLLFPDRAAAVGGAGNPAVEDQPPPTRTETEVDRIFVNSMSDLFHDDVPDEFIARVFAVMAATPRRTYQLLTKRHARMRSLIGGADGSGQPLLEASEDEQTAQRLYGAEWPLPNLWLGVSVEDQKWADIRIPALLGTAAAVRWISAEPLLGPVDLGSWLVPMDFPVHIGCDGAVYGPGTPVLNKGLGWVVVGGESGPGARPMHPQWARGLRDQCQAAGVSFFMKQFGAWRPLLNGEYPAPGETRTLHYRGDTTDPILVRHGGHNGQLERFPPDLQIREYPEVSHVG